MILAAEPVTDIDTTAAETLREILDEFEARNIQLAFAELKGPVKDRLRTTGCTTGSATSTSTRRWVAP